MIGYVAVVTLLGSFSGTASAKTRCSIQRENKREALTFDKAIYSDEITEPTAVLIRRDGSVLRHFDLGNDMPRLVKRFGVHRTMEKLSGAVMVTLTPAENNFSISTNHFDFERKSSAVTTDATTFGDPSRSLMLFDGINRLGISCSDDF